MFLIIENTCSDFGDALEGVSRRKNLETLHLTSEIIAKELLLSFDLSDRGEGLSLALRGRTYEAADIEGCFCGLDSFSPAHWSHFTKEDAEYAARETHALWLAILTSLKQRVLNPPAPDLLGGTLLTPVELYEKARDSGLSVPMVLYVESGRTVRELLEMGSPIRVSDLGCDCQTELLLTESSGAGLQDSRNCHRVREVMLDSQIWISLIGERFYACIRNSEGNLASYPIGEIPQKVREPLRALQKKLKLRVGEYGFNRSADGFWTLLDARRTPELAWLVEGEKLLDELLNTLLFQGFPRKDE